MRRAVESHVKESADSNFVPAGGLPSFARRPGCPDGGLERRPASATSRRDRNVAASVREQHLCERDLAAVLDPALAVSTSDAQHPADRIGGIVALDRLKAEDDDGRSRDGWTVSATSTRRREQPRISPPPLDCALPRHDAIDRRFNAVCDPLSRMSYSASTNRPLASPALHEREEDRPPVMDGCSYDHLGPATLLALVSLEAPRPHSSTSGTSTIERRHSDIIHRRREARP